MEFNSHPFLLVFLPSVVIAYSLIPIKFRLHLLVVCSLIFYAYSGFIPLILLLFSIFIAYSFIKFSGIESFSKEKIKYLFFFACLLITAPFLVIKYLFPSIDWLGGLIGLEIMNHLSGFTANILLPAGISFYTFQLLSSVIDSKNNKISLPGFVELIGFASFFPQLIAGPILRLNELLPQLRALTKSRRSKLESINDISCGLKLIAVGLFAKTMIADVLSSVCDRIDLSKLTTLDSIYLVLAKSVIIYADFFGYSTMAIGLGLLFGIKLPRNFLQPYCSPNIQEFWRRWHVTLGRWFFDYVYKPLGGRKNYVFSILVVFMLVGVWHGYGLQFLIWGFSHGISMIFYIGFIRKNKKLSFLLNISTLITFIWVSLLWVLFFYSVSDSLIIYKSLFNFDITQPIASFQLIGPKRCLFLVLCLIAIFIVDDDIFFESSRHNFEKTPSLRNRLPKIEKRFLNHGGLYIPSWWNTEVGALKGLRQMIARLFDKYLQNPLLVPFIILASMLFFSYRATFVYFRF